MLANAAIHKQLKLLDPSWSLSRTRGGAGVTKMVPFGVFTTSSFLPGRAPRDAYRMYTRRTRDVIDETTS